MGRKILILLEHLRVEHTIQHRSGDMTIDFLSSGMGSLLKRKLKSENIDMKDVDIEYVYPKVPDAKTIDTSTKKPISYKDVPMKAFKYRYAEMDELITRNKYDIVIPTGRMGCKYLLNNVSITKLQGVPELVTIETEKDNHDFWVFPMFSMEYIDFKKNAELLYDSSLKTLKTFLDEGDSAFRPSDVKYDFIETMDEVRNYFKFLKDNKLTTAWDLETNTLRGDMKGSKALVISISHAENQGVTIPMEHREHTWGEGEFEEMLELIKDYVANPELTKVLQGGQFDIRFLMSVYGFKATDFNRNLDTKVAYFLVVSQEKAKSFKLTDIAYEMTDMGGYDKPLEEWKSNYIKEYKEEHKKSPVNEVDGSNFSYEWFPLKDVLAPYASGDVDATLRIHNRLMEKIKTSPKWIDLYENFYPRLTVALAQAESNGFKADMEYLNNLKVVYAEELERIIQAIRKTPQVQQLEDEAREMYEIGLKEWAKPKSERDLELAKLRDKYKKKLEFNPKSSPDKGRLLFDIIGAVPPISKETLKDSALNKPENELEWSDYKTDKDMIKWIHGNVKGVEELTGLLVEYSEVSTLMSTFVTGLSKAVNHDTGMIHGTFNSTGTECVSGDTIVFTDKGLLPISELGNTREDKTFDDIDINVASKEGIESASAFYYSGFGKGLKFTLADGTELITSLNHPLWVNNYIKRGKALNKKNKAYKEKHIHDNEWVTAESITEKDYLTLSMGDNLYGNITEIDFNVSDYLPTATSHTKVALVPTELTPEFSEWLGMYMADGSIHDSNGAIGVGISNDDPQVINRFSELSEKVFGLSPKVTYYEGKTPRVLVSSTHIGRYLLEVIDLPRGSKNKTVPDLVLRSTKANQQSFIRGLTLDSSVHKKKYPSLYLSSVSRDMMNKVKMMLTNMGIFSKLSHVPVPTTIRAEHPEYNDIYQLQITYEQLETFMGDIGLVEDVKSSVVYAKLRDSRDIKGKRTGVVIEGNRVFSRVERVEYVYEVELFDLHVPESHSFVGNGVVNHNTSRLSSSSPNLQNIPSSHQNVDKFDYQYPIKRIFTTRFEGGAILQADYSALEMRVLGLRAGDPGMTEAFLEGKDLHKNTASIVFGKPEEEISKDERSASKSIAFGIVYGEQPFSLAPKLGISQQEAEELFEKFFREKPQIKQFIEDVHKFLDENGYVETMHGHRRLLRDVWGNKQAKSGAYRQSVNTIIQGTGAYLTNFSFILIQDYLITRNKKSKLVATVHDSIVIDLHPDEIEEITEITKLIMENLPIDFLNFTWNGQEMRYPITSDVEIGSSYKDLVDYDPELFKQFKSAKGYIKYLKDQSILEDHKESGKITPEQLEEGIRMVEAQIEAYKQI